MKLSADIWKQFAEYLKSQLLTKFEPGTLGASDEGLHVKLEHKHRGFYVGIMNSSGEHLTRVGFLEQNNPSILDSGNKVIEGLHADLKAKGIVSSVLMTSSFSCTVIWDMAFNNNGLAWDENEDGVYFTWGDKYKGMYLPYEIHAMGVPKTEIMNRLCSWEAGVPSNLWRLPEGLVHRLICDSYTL